MAAGPEPDQRIEIEYELELLLQTEYPDWRKRKYLSTNFIIAGLGENPEQYPILSKVKLATVRRWLNWHLRNAGRVPTNENASQIRTWTFPQEQMV
jgi:hypothetical protein